MLGFSLPRSRPWRDLAARVATINGLAWVSPMILYRYAGFQPFAPHAALNKRLVASAGVPSTEQRSTPAAQWQPLVA